MAAPSQAPAEAAGPSKRLLVVEVGLVMGLFSLTLAALPASRVLAGGAAEHVLLLLRMAAFVALCTYLLRRSGTSWRDIGLRRPKSWYLVIGTVLLGYGAIIAFVQMVAPILLEAVGGAPRDLSAFAVLKGNLAQYLFFAFPVALGTAAFGEELIARGYLLNRLAEILGRERRSAYWLAALAQGFAFGLAHAYQGPGGIITTGAIGTIFGAIYLLSGRNLWGCIVLHGLIDFISVTVLYLGLLPAA